MVNAPPLATAYGVWIEGQGWLKREPDSRATVFASLDREVAQTAAALWGEGATVLAFDDSLADFEPIFLEHQRTRVSAQKAGWRWPIWNK